jgi:hypothetical protein
MGTPSHRDALTSSMPIVAHNTITGGGCMVAVGRAATSGSGANEGGGGVGVAGRGSASRASCSG